MWFRIDESKNDKDFYLEQINEAMADAARLHDR